MSSHQFHQFVHWNCFCRPSSQIAKIEMDWNFKNDELGKLFQVFILCLQKSPKQYYYLDEIYRRLLQNSTGTDQKQQSSWKSPFKQTNYLIVKSLYTKKVSVERCINSRRVVTVHISQLTSLPPPPPLPTHPWGACGIYLGQVGI